VGKLITLDDAAERLAISKRGVRRLVSSGKLKAYRINARVIRVDSADLAIYTKYRKVPQKYQD